MGLSIRRMWIVDDGQIGPKHLGWQVADQNTRTHSHWMSLQKEQEGKYFEAGTLDRDQNRCRCPFNVLKSPSSRSELILFDRFWILKTSYHYKFACALDMATIVCFYCYWTKLGWGNHYRYKLNSFLWRVLEGRVYALGGLYLKWHFPIPSFLFCLLISNCSVTRACVFLSVHCPSWGLSLFWWAHDGMGVHRASASASSAHHQQHQRIINSISASAVSAASPHHLHQHFSSISASAASVFQRIRTGPQANRGV